jgi:hypothetical protein
MAEIEMKTVRGRAIYAEVEESEQRCGEALVAFELLCSLPTTLTTKTVALLAQNLGPSRTSHDRS